jgi:hypothetical protein
MEKFVPTNSPALYVQKYGKSYRMKNKRSWLIIKSETGYEVVEDLHASANASFVNVKHWDGVTNMINRSCIIAECEDEHKALTAKMKGEEKEKQIRTPYLVMLDATNKARVWLEMQVLEVITKELKNGNEWSSAERIDD